MYRLIPCFVQFGLRHTMDIPGHSLHTLRKHSWIKEAILIIKLNYFKRYYVQCSTTSTCDFENRRSFRVEGSIQLEHAIFCKPRRSRAPPSDRQYVRSSGRTVGKKILMWNGTPDLLIRCLPKSRDYPSHSNRIGRDCHLSESTSRAQIR